MQVFGIVGWKNNGKTTLVEGLISNLTQRGYKVASIKHAHHDLDLDEPGRDSYRHRVAGTTQTMLATGKRWTLMHEYRDQPEAPLEQLLQAFAPCDLVIVEGYKQGPHDKLEVVRQPNERGLLAHQVPNIKAIATDLDNLQADVPLLDINDIDHIADWILQHTGLLKSAEEATGNNPNDCYSSSQNLLATEAVWQAMQNLTQPHGRQQQRPLDECHNLVLADNIISTFDSPRFDNVAVDGWALCYADLQAHHYCLPIMAGVANAGVSQHIELQPGHCLRVFTGARMPAGADTVVMQEDVQPQSDKIQFAPATKANTNWRPRGEDVRQGDIILTQGRTVRPQDIGLAAATGNTRLPVYMPVKVALFSTGDEVYEIGSELPEDGIYDVNRHLLKALYQDLRCQVTDLGIIADDYDSLYQALSQAAQEHDLIITSGGASTGDHDHIAQVLAALGEVHAWRVAIKPGRPLAFGTLNAGQTLFLGLPGNPVAANVCSLMFGAPLVQALAGSPWQKPASYPQTLGFAINKKAGRREWIRVFRQVQEDGSVLLKRSAAHGSGILTSMTKADGLVEVDEDTRFLPAGSSVNFIPFSVFGISS
ncbi:MAG: bifunctional molybdopterin-guanine dinucleotide biosynthesis adaptor protein MobB/molybdopterin molybdotransferase MoeA [Gammaproteobacteria bacterium]|nr:bifunctional molybdopterin-guanine dinucleotide biosynthesis adaptor protein MobB/molybdopterin molybdotransferase MoeA [Gammaproteobacteria bacterium]